MRIFQSVGASTNTLVPRNQTWLRNLYEPLVEMGHDVVLLPPAVNGPVKPGDPRRGAFSQQLVDAVRKAHAERPIDLFFAYFMDGAVEPGAVDAIRGLGIPTCNFSCNNIHQFDLVRELSPHFDVNLYAEKAAAPKFAEIGAAGLWWPMASNPKYFHPWQVARDVAVSFVGANYALRAQYIVHLLDHGVDVQAFGPGWPSGDKNPWRALVKRAYFLARSGLTVDPQRQFWATAKLHELDFRRSVAARYPTHVHPPVSDDELIALYSRSQISLGFLEVFDAHDPSRPIHQHLHLREFEAPMSGALYCTGYMDELAEHFVPDQEVLVYHNRHDLLEKVTYYLAHPAEADRIRAAGLRRALADHTYHRRFRTLFQVLGLE